MLCSERPHFEFPTGARDGLWGPQFYYLMCTGSEAAERKVQHSPPSSAEVKNKWSRTSAPSMYLHGVETDKFTVSPFASFKLTANSDSL